MTNAKCPVIPLHSLGPSHTQFMQISSSAALDFRVHLPPVVVAVFLDRWTSGRGGLRDVVDVAWQIGIDLFDI